MVRPEFQLAWWSHHLYCLLTLCCETANNEFIFDRAPQEEVHYCFDAIFGYPCHNRVNYFCQHTD